MILRSYMHIIPELFSREEVAEIHQIADGLDEHVGMVGIGKGGDLDDPVEHAPNVHHNIRRSKIKWIQKLPPHLQAKVDEGMTLACTGSDWPFELIEHQSLQYTIYEGRKIEKGDFYTWHADDGPEYYDLDQKRKLSYVVQLSDPDDYEGGLFQWIEMGQTLDQLQLGQTEIDITNAIQTLPFSGKAIGSMFVFPSFVQHQVTPVTSGVRKSLVGWFTGRHFR